ncbi:VOC family protein [Luteimonas salinilitoris]|uniref:VOC family protein n=1 Tax=Luteimonas salinilitoris TaxID=3237697 RepID=A0ABV4HT90_9GAMM
MSVDPIPHDRLCAVPHLVVEDADAAIAFYREAFGAVETMRLVEPGGKIAHAEVRIGTAPVMLAEPYPELGFVGPRALAGTAVSFTLYVDDVDARFDRAVAAGASVRQAVRDEFYGDRCGQLSDPFGHLWTLATRIEDVSAEEMARRFARCFPSPDNA